MKKVILPISMFMACSGAFAAVPTCAVWYEPITCSGSGGIKYGDATNASNYDTLCFKECDIGGCGTSVALRVINPTSCNSGYELQSATYSNYYSSQTCLKLALVYGSCCAPTTTYGDWTNCKIADGGLDCQKSTATTTGCNTTTTTTTVYRCLAGYYSAAGLATASSRTDLSCTSCTTATGVTSTSVNGATSITQCYVPAGSSRTDEKGTYTYSSDCYYSN